MPLPTASTAGRVQAHAAQTCLASPFLANSLKQQAAPRAHHARASPSTMGPVSAVAAPRRLERPDATGRFGRFGGKYVPETLIAALAELEVAYASAMADPEFVVRRGEKRDGDGMWGRGGTCGGGGRASSAVCNAQRAA